MKLNNKGFAISAILYSMLILFLAIVLVVIMILASSKYSYNTIRDEILDDLNTITSSDTLMYNEGDLIYYNPVTGKACDYVNSYDYLDTGTCYTWYVIQNSPISETNVILVMNQNLPSGSWDADGNVAWYSSATNTVGPVTVLTALQNGTSNWNELDDLVSYDYPNRGKSGSNGYTEVIVENNDFIITSNDTLTTNEVDGLKARLLTLDEIDELGCTTIAGSCPSWLYGNLGSSAYWLLTSDSSSATNSYAVSYNGNYISSSTTSTYGVRPVIEINKRSLLICDNNGICSSSNPTMPEYISSTVGADTIEATYTESTDSNSIIKTYRCYYSTNEDNLKNVGTVTDLTCTISGLTPLTTYYYMMCATNSFDRTTCSAISTSTTLES